MYVCLKVLIAEIENIKTIVLNDIEFEIDLRWGGDMKFLLNIYGINAANSTFSCFWCKCSKNDFWKIDYDKWSIDNPEKGARTIKDANKCTLNGKKA